MDSTKAFCGATGAAHSNLPDWCTSCPECHIQLQEPKTPIRGNRVHPVVVLDDTPETPESLAETRKALFISGSYQPKSSKARTVAESARQQSMNATRKPSTTLVQGLS
jgi:hypothetical protein